MQHFRSLEDVRLEDVYLTIGSFDGVHLGHKAIIQELTAGARAMGVPAVVLTFFPHPKIVLRGKNYPFYLTSPDEKAAILGDLGVDVVITHPFNRRVANTPAQDFIRQLASTFRIRHLQVGYDFALGKNRSGNYALLQELSQELGYTLAQTPPVEVEGDVVSSSRIRFLLGVGQVDLVARLLGRQYTIQGLVEIGDQRGHTLGFPTANLSVWAERILPTAGVYACRVKVRGKTWGAVTNIGVRPTFEAAPVAPRVETHILDFHEDIYGETIQVAFITRLRAEVKFPSVEDLVRQIQADVAQARAILHP